MAAGNNSFLVFQTLGGATAGSNNPDDIGSFTYDPSQGELVTVNEGAGSTSDDAFLEDSRSPATGFFGDPSLTDDQTLVNAPSWIPGAAVGTEVTAVNAFNIRDSGGNVVGTVNEIAYDDDGDGEAHSDSAIGFVIVANPPLVPGTIYTVDSLIFGAGDGTFAYADAAVCFARGTLIKTKEGERPIEDLRAGDPVLTMDNGYQPISWIGGRKLSRADLDANPKLKPIRIRAGALGNGLPEQDLLVSPQHRVLVRSVICIRMFDTQELLVPAKKLLAVDGIDIEWEADGVEYFHMLFSRHEIVWSNGAPSESLFTGSEALKAVSPEAADEIRTLFPEICAPDYQPVPARHIPEKGKLVKKLAQRLQANRKPVYEM